MQVVIAITYRVMSISTIVYFTSIKAMAAVACRPGLAQDVEAPRGRLRPENKWAVSPKKPSRARGFQAEPGRQTTIGDVLQYASMKLETCI